MLGRKGVVIVVMAAIALCAIATRVSAQITTGSIAGTVKDAQGGVIPGATVTLTNEGQGTKAPPVVSGSTGDFVFVNIPAGSYMIEVTMPSFKALKRTGIAVSGGTRNSLGSLTLEVGGATEVVDVKAEAPIIQATSGERSFTVATASVENLPIAGRSFINLAELAPGMNGTNRDGGGGGRNVLMDGVSTMDTGSNSILLQMTVESIAEVKVLVSNYQAEYGRSSGVQISAVTKSGTNRFRGSLYDVERNSEWNANSKTNKLNGNPKNVSKERDWGYSIGGPIGKPGKTNKLFFFYSQEYAPRTQGANVTTYRFPTALERAGDFSQTLDNNGALYPYIKDPNLTAACTAATTAGCFADGGVLGRIPANRLYSLGLGILNAYPLPNCPGPSCTTWLPNSNYNYSTTSRNESALAWQPAVRVDYQPLQSLRVSIKYSGWQQKQQVFAGSLPGWTESKMQNPIVSTMAYTGNYTLTPSTFFEVTYGHSQNELAGCALAQGGTGPTFCNNGLPMSPASNRVTSGFGGLPLLFPNAAVINPDYYAFRVFEKIQPPSWDGKQLLLAPSFSYGNRVSNSPPGFPFPGYLNINATDDIAISMTKVWGSHTLKAGFYNTHSYKAQQRGGWAGTISFGQDTVGTNPCDTSYGFANAAMGCFSSFGQSSKYVEGNFVYNNTEPYVQDNWKVSRKLTLDYGARFVHQQPQYDDLGQASNFFIDKWSQASAPTLYVPACANGVYPCSGTNRQAMNPLTGQLLGTNSSLAIGTIVPNSGNPTNGLFLSGQGIAKTTYTWPALRVAPRVGMAFDVSGNQRIVLRGGGGLFFDRPSGNSIYSQVQNPPTYKSITARYGTLQQLSTGGLTTEGVPSLNIFNYAAGLPSSFQWNGGVQMTLPFAMSLDVEYVGQHSWNMPGSTNLNSIDLGATLLAKNTDPTLAPTTPGATAFSTDLLRPIRGYGSISQQLQNQWSTYHSIQWSLQRRFSHGISFGFNDTMGISQTGNTSPRWQHAADGTYSFRADQADADRLLGKSYPVAHRMKGNFVWDLPDLKSDKPAVKAIGLVVNDWQLSGIWTAATGSSYTVSYSYQSGGGAVNLTGSPDFDARIRVVGDPGKGCNYKDLYRQFNTSAFQGPLVGSVGLESASGGYLRGCFSSVLDLAIARNIRLPKGRNIQLRVDMFNAPNEGRITGRATSISLTTPTDPVTLTNSPFDLTGAVTGTVGALLPTRVRPNQAGFGAVSGYQGPRTVQGQVRFSF